jgi:hypothetical protein
MNYKKITAAITAICLLSVATGATALAAKNIAADTAEDSVVTEETTEATEETTEEATDEEAAEDEEATDAPEVEAPEAEKPSNDYIDPDDTASLKRIAVSVEENEAGVEE